MPEEIDKNKATLSKAERAMYDMWAQQYKDTMGKVGELINDLHTARLLELGKEKGLDMDNEDWTFDHTNVCFVKRPAPVPTIPGKDKAGDK